MIEIKDRRIIINRKSEIIMSGEIHYFRLKKSEWQDRIDKLKEAGFNTVASYVPWICHEYTEGQIDLVGNTRPELDLGYFIDLCKENGLYFFLRPGPFIMAEMKNEGIPYWVYKKHSEAVPISWDEKSSTTKTLDYLNPGFLESTKNWYRALSEIVVPRLETNGGNIIGMQLDNEIGMLSWVSNSPDLTDYAIEDFSKWLNKHYDTESLENRYPFDFNNTASRNSCIRSPREDYSLELHHDLGYFMRNRFSRYVALLRSYAEEYGIKDIPFVVNIHGTGGGRGLTYPIGISQLYESYTNSPGYISGSDIYFGDLNMDTFQDLYIINGFMDAVNTSDQPLTSVEFNCGDCNFGEKYSTRTDPSATDLKARMCIAQSHRMLNYYLFTGGTNYRIDNPLGDGNDRVAITGERHGFAAPINPEGEYNFTYPRMVRGIKAINAISDKLSEMNEEHDDVAYAFIPDYFLTEYHYPKSEKNIELIKNLEATRAGEVWETVGRAMLLAGYRFTSIDIQNKPVNSWEYSTIIVPSAKYMAAEIQQKIVDYIKLGGGVLLHGEVPSLDMEGNPCTILSDAAEIKVKDKVRDENNFYLSVYPDGWAAPRPEIRAYYAQTFEVKDACPLMRIYGTDEVCSFDKSIGNGRLIVFAHSYRCDIPLITEMIVKLGAKPKLTHDYKHHGIFMTSSSKNDDRFLHLINLDGLDKEFHIYENEEKLLGGRKLLLQSRDGVMLPINVTYNDVKIIYSTAEIMLVNPNSIEFRLTQRQDVIALNTSRKVLPSPDYTIQYDNDSIIITSTKHSKVDNYLLISFK